MPDSYNSPPIVLGIQQEVGAYNGNTDSDNGEYDEDEKHKSIDVVDLVRPERREYKVPATTTEPPQYVNAKNR